MNLDISIFAWLQYKKSKVNWFEDFQTHKKYLQICKRRENILSSFFALMHVIKYFAKGYTNNSVYEASQ